jgi:hypothetical protein
MKLPIKIIFSAALVAVVLACTVPAAAADHYLIVDQFNNRVIEVDHRGNIVWHFGLGPADFSPASIIGVNDAQRVGEFTLMAGTGTPGGQPEAPNCTNPSGCPDDRVILVDRGGNIVWQYGQFGVAWQTGPSPTRAVRLRHGHTLISDQYNHRVIEVNHAKHIVHTWGKLDSLGYNAENVADGGLNSPYDAKAVGDYTGLTPPF